MTSAAIDVDIKHFHLFCGLGGGARGFNKGQARVGNMRAKFRCIGGIDSDPASIRDFSNRAGAPGTVMDLFSIEQFIAFHGKEPPIGWRQAMPEDIRRAAGNEFPNIVFLSAPCKGFSGLLPEKSSITDKYQALNALTLRGVWLTLEAFKDDPPELLIFENVPRIAKRGRHLLDQIIAILRSYNYAVSETTHDCGEIGGLGQSRKRFLLVARHQIKVPPFLYEPERKRLRGVGEILEALPMPGDLSAGPMHRMPSLQWKTWVRLAFVEAGSDWRSLNKLAVEDGQLRDFAIEPDTEWQSGVLGVRRWEDTSGVVAGRSSPTNGAFSVADPRFHSNGNEYSQYGVRDWGDTSGAIINVKSPGQGSFSIADPRIEGKPRFNNVFRIVPWGDRAPAVAGPGGPAGGLAVADPRPANLEDKAHVKYRVTSYDEAAGTVIGASTTGNGAFAVADPLPYRELRNGAYGVRTMDETSGVVAGESLPSNGAFAVADPRPVGLNANREHYQTGGHYGVVKWNEKSRAVPGFAKYDRGPFAVADPREAEPSPLADLPKPEDRLVAVIRALDGTWHRPFTTLELAALQSLVDPEELSETFALDGQSDAGWRERIGNAVPPAAAEAIAGVMGTTILLARSGQTFMLSNQPIWVRPLVTALAVDHTPNDIALVGDF
ncbi:DNA cytosine methyltransferase [Agrobacterium salinitolerans]|uniref:DNA cytosine methyltransferase n=1 Tax=Agrobacterium salinitolerans TaxID=1183413 RepID=A0A4Z1RBP6_9HYPH|nr:DNA cytosine methyltransferase [Agrobacterium salinitolerans]UYZ08581.1 DNA cytosine methyltransferase [Agrobacterium salinitolerans]